MKALFVDQGRADENAAMGHVRVKHALDVGLDGGVPDLEIAFADVPPFKKPEIAFTWYFESLDLRNFGSVRWHLARGWQARRLIRRWARGNRPDVVHVTTDQVSFLLEGVQRQVPCVLSLDVLTADWVRMKRYIPLDGEPPRHLEPIAPLERRALESAPLNIAWTETVAGRIRELAPAARTATLHPGMDLEAFRPAAAGAGPGRLRVLFVGGRFEAKGGHDLIAALQPELGQTVELDIVTTEEVPDTDGVTVHRASPGSDEIVRLFERADVFCLPTSVDAVPWVVLEAMASGVPVVSTTVGSIPEMVGDAGLVVAPRDRDALRGALLELLGDPARRRSMSEAGRARCEERYDARQNAPRLIETLREVADAHGRG